MLQDHLSATFSALANPTRRAILASLISGAASVQELAAPFHISLPAVSKHLRVLERAGLIERGREAQWRPCRLRGEALREAANWLDRYRQFWEESFNRLDLYLQEVQREEKRKVEIKSSGLKHLRAKRKKRRNVDKKRH